MKTITPSYRKYVHEKKYFIVIVNLTMGAAENKILNSIHKTIKRELRKMDMA